MIGRATESDTADINFYYASGPGFIVEQRLSAKALTAFDSNVMDALVELPTRSDTCYVQSIILSAGSQRVLLAVHNEDNDDPEDVFRCLIAGLWKFQGRDMRDLDVSDWRASFHRLTEIGSN